MHAAIAINRTWISFSLMKGTSVWDKFGQKLTWLLPLIPLIVLSPRFGGTVKVYYTANKDISGMYNEPFVKAQLSFLLRLQILL
uniref:Uncharacterized protein n=1 Tax=Panagrolaimus davidi TaxID=227884 RepID=A0A914PQZ2_9BILA